MKLYQELGLDLWKTEDGWHHFFICIRFDPQNYSLTPMNLPAIVILLVTKLYIVEQIYFETFLHFSINEWIKLDPNIRPLDSHAMLGKKRGNFYKAFWKKHLQYKCFDPQRSKFLNRLRLDFCYKHKQKFHHNFAGTVNPLCSCALETESNDYFFRRCQNYRHFAQPFWRIKQH